jgi:hypothetical protein
MANTKTTDATSSSGYFVPVTKADANLTDGVCRGLLVGTAGTANLMDAKGNTRANVPLQAGYNPLSVLQVRTGGTADAIFALY